MKKDNYEISLWEDILIESKYIEISKNLLEDNKIYYFYDETKKKYFSKTGKEAKNTIINKWYEMIPEHFEEQKIATIGSNTMNAQWKAIEPNLISNINGTNTLTFKMFYNYVDVEDGIKKQNPFIKKMVNERKIKVKWKNKWYNLVIKNIQEDSNGNSVIYTCKDQFINELSKNGFNLEFSNELMNNQGTIQELTNRVLDGTDWKIGNCDITYQTVEEPVYELNGINVKTFKALDELNNEEVEIKAGSKILVYYSVFNEKKSYFQFHYVEDGLYDTEFNSMLVINGKSLSINVNWNENGNEVKINNNTIIEFPENLKISQNYRAKRYIKQQLQEFDNLTEQYCYVYNDKQDGSGNKIYGYMTTETNNATTVVNLISNNGYNGFTDSQGWTNSEQKVMDFGLQPPLSTYKEGEEDIEDYLNNAKSYLNFNKNIKYLNSGIKNNIQYLPDGFKKGEVYIFRYKAVTISNSGVITEIKPTDDDLPIQVFLGTYNVDDLTLKNSYFSSSKIQNTEDNWIEYELKCTASISKNNILSNNFGLIFYIGKNFWLREAQFFKYALGQDEKRINPNIMDTESVLKVVYKYYYAEDSKNITDIEDLTYIYEDINPSTEFYPTYSKNIFEKIRSIEIKQSNRFNIIQTLAETFEYYPKFEIINDFNTGKIDYYKRDENNKLTNEYTGPQKFINFYENIGKNTGLTFVYGIDLKTISRTINSEQIVTKTIVLQNSNKYAKNGFCTIARASENYSKSNFILNFDYYISQGLMDKDKINNDLYGSSSTGLGYYYNLNRLNSEDEINSEILFSKEDEFSILEKQLNLHKNYINSAQETINNIKKDIQNFIGVNNLTIKKVKDYLKENENNTFVKNQLITWINLENNIDTYEKVVNNLENVLGIPKDGSEEKGIYKKIKECEEKRKIIKKELEQLDKDFYVKYNNYIQEGSWNSEEYIDDNLYYFDASSVAYTSSKPQISYNISVLRLSSLEDFKNKKFNIGDIASIQDTDFFGYIYTDGIKTPYKEKVLISEVSSFFDNPEKDTLKIQNYKTQFEDLFQRIVATTQSLQYSTGQYQRAANIVDNNGAIKGSVLENTLKLNQNLVFNYQDNNIISDSSGITLIDNLNSNNQVKLTSGGITFTNDGQNWKTGIDASGVRTDSLTSGSINTENITIYSGNSYAFRWGSEGISAYSQKDGEVNFNKFVRFDQYGIYGVNGVEENENEVWAPNNETEVWNKANFGITWEGFFLKNKEENNQIEISTENDISVFKLGETSTDDIQRIKIGKINEEGEEVKYGIRIKDDNNNKVLETNNNGELWISGEFTGKITGAQSQIGNYTLEQINEAIKIIQNNKKIEIQSLRGNIFKINNELNTSFPQNFELTLITQNFVNTPIFSSIKWYGSLDFLTWNELASETNIFNLTYDIFKQENIENVYYIKVIAIDSENNEYINYKTFIGI